jgi:phage-related protein
VAARSCSYGTALSSQLNPGRAVSIAVVDEASIKITPDTSGFAAELRRELEAEIAAATAGLDDVIHIRVDVDGEAARDKLANVLDSFQDDGTRAFRGLRDEERDLFNDIEQNAEKARIKQTLEQTKLRDKLRALWAPALQKLKREQIEEKVRLDKITAAALKAAKAVGQVGERSTEASARAEAALTKARVDAEKAAAALAKAESDLERARAAVEVATTRQQAAEDRHTAAMSAGQRAVDALQKAERELTEARLSGDTDRIVKAEENLDKARERVATRSAAAANAEAAVVAARSATATASERVVASEEKLSTSRDKVIASTDRVVESERRIVQAHNDASQAGERHGNVMTRLGQRGGILGGIMRGLGGAFSAAGSFASSLGSTLSGALSSAVEGASGGAQNAAQSFLKLGGMFTVVLGVAGLVSYAVGAVGAALAGIPALAMAGAASFAVFALGMDGIKKAYEVGLKPALDKLKVQVSDVFEKTLTPIMQRLGNELIPRITDEMTGLAQAFADGGVKLGELVLQEPNLQKIEQIINNTASAVREQLTPALTNVVQEFINIGAQKPVMDAMVGVIADLVNNTANWLAEMQRIGLLTPAVQALRSALDTVEKAFFQILTAAINFFTQSTPGFNNLMTAVADLASSLLNDLGGAFNTALQAASNFINNIPPSALDGFKQAVRDLSQAMLDFANSGAPELIVQGITAVITGFREFMNMVSGIVGAYTEVKLAIAELDNALGIATTSEIEMLRAHGRAAGEANGLADSLAGVEPPARAAGDAMGAAAPQTDAAAAAMNGVAPPTDAARAALDAMRPPAERAAGALDGVGTAAGALPPAVQPPMDETQRAVTVTFDSLPPAIQAAMTNSEAAARTGADLIKTAVTDGFNGAAQAAQTAITNIQNAVQTGFTTVTTTAQTAMTTLTTTITSGFTAVQTAVVNAMTQIETAVTTSMTNVQTTVTTATTAMQTAVETATTAMATAFESSFTAMQTSATNAMTQIETAVTTSMTNIQTTIQTTFTTVVTTVTTSMQQVVQTIATSLQQIQQNWQQTWQQIVQITQQSWQQINAAIAAGGQQAVAKCREIAQQILQVFQELAPQLEAAGRTMMERLAAGITAGGAAAVAAARNVAAQIKAQFPASPAKEGPLSGRGDPLRTGGVIIQRLADGMRNAQSYLMRQLIPIMNATAKLIARPGAARPANGWTVSTSTAGVEPSAVRLLDTPSSAPDIFRGNWQAATKWNASNGGILAEDGSYVNPGFYDKKPSGPSAQDIRAALEGMSIRFDDSGSGLAKLVNRQQRSLARR